MDQTRNTPLHPDELTRDALRGAPLFDAADQRLGTLSHLHGSAPDCDIAVSVDGATGSDGKMVVVNMTHFTFVRDEAGVVRGITTLSRDQLAEMPEHGSH